MKRRFVAVLLSLCLILAFIPVSAMAVEFDDAQGHWAEAAIDRWSDAGVVSGVGNNDFDPEGEMNRAQAASVASFQSPGQAGLMRPSGTTAVASAMSSPAPLWARLPRCIRCQSPTSPSRAEYWHMGGITMRLSRVRWPS